MTPKAAKCIRWTLDPSREGGYANVPGDRGGETYRGISRKFHPQWDGWETLDNRKPIPHNRIFDDLESRVEQFYVKEYWEQIDGEELPYPVDMAVFDLAVHSGWHRAESVLDAIREEVALSGDEEPSQIAEAVWRWRAHYLVNRAFEADQVKFLRGWMGRIQDGLLVIRGGK